MELRKGIVRDGVFKYIASKKKENCKEELFFKPEAVRENCFKDYLLETVRYLVKQGESTLIFFATCAETQKWNVAWKKLIEILADKNISLRKSEEKVVKTMMKANVRKINQQTYDVLLKKKLIKDKVMVQQSLLTSR